MVKSSDIDLTHMTKEQILAGMGDLLLGMLGTNRVAVAVMSDSGAVTFLNPMAVQHIPPEALVGELLEAWAEDEVESLLGHIYG